MENIQPKPTQNLVKFWTNTQDKYDRLLKKEPSTVYFCSDSQEIYKGDNCYTGSVKIVDKLPTIIRKDTLYIIPNGESSGGYIYPSSGNDWEKIICGDVFKASSILSLEDIPIATETIDGFLCCEDKRTYDRAVSKVSTIENSYPVKIETKVEEDRTKTYTFKQGENVVGEVSIPKATVIESGSVVYVPANTIMQDGKYLPEGEYLKLVLASESSDDIYISLADLASLYTAGDGIIIKDNVISLNVDTTNGLTMTDGKLGLNLQSLEVGSSIITVKTGESEETEMPLEEVVNTLYQSSVWKNM